MPKKKQTATESTENTEVIGAARPVYGFAHGKRCPACASTDTEARSTQGNIQYRHCRRVGCPNHHKNYAVIGKEI